MYKTPRYFQYAAVSLPLIAGLVSCNTQTTPSDPLASFRKQPLNWYTCDPTVVPMDGLLQAAGDRAQCADVKVPLDYSQPAKGSATVSVLRYKAGNPDKRQGAIFFNPGGPGGDGLYLGALFGFIWSNGNPVTPLGAKLKQLSDEYDMVGFSPRGTGSSFRTTCGTNEALSPTKFASADQSAKNLAAMERNSKLIAQACLKSPTTQYINTDLTARDMDLIRELMKDQKLNYIGYSYGTWLGAWYAKLFPSRAGKMVLDSNTAFERNLDETFMMQPQSFERHFREVVLGYTARHHDIYGLGATAAEAYKTYDAFPAGVKQALQNTGMISKMYGSYGIVEIPVDLAAARGVSELVKQGLKDFDLIDAVGSYPFLKDPELNAMAVQSAYNLVFAYLNYQNDATGTVEMDSGTAVFFSVMCNDTPNTLSTYKGYQDLAKQQAKDSPLIGGDATNPCSFWNTPRAQKPATPSAKDMPPLLLLQNEYDPPTATEGAISALKATPNARMVFIDNEASHGIFPYGTECVDLPVLDYFLKGTLPAKTFNVCEARPLPSLVSFFDPETELVPAEQQTYEVGQSYDANSPIPNGVSKQGLPYSLRIYQNPVEAQKVIAEIHKVLERNALKPYSVRLHKPLPRP